ncbi:hypothetical protein CHKEEEPN_3648 [Methylorubrum podarium]|nr:hypothetical protein CHKEEEPN_3648 [Methylorubrum podarium]
MPEESRCLCSIPSAMWRGFSPLITAPTMASAAPASCTVVGAFSKFIATAVASISIWPSSSVAV